MCNGFLTKSLETMKPTDVVGEMAQNSQRLYSFTFNVIIIIIIIIIIIVVVIIIIIIIQQYIYSHSATKFLFKKYIYSHLTTYFLLTNIFTRIYGMSLFSFNGFYSFTFTIEILVQHGTIFIQHFLRTLFAHQIPVPANV